MGIANEQEGSLLVRLTRFVKKGTVYVGQKVEVIM